MEICHYNNEIDLIGLECMICEILENMEIYIYEAYINVQHDGLRFANLYSFEQSKAVQ